MTMQRSPFHAHRERGVVLFIALIALVAMSLAGVALMRSVGSGVLLAGNVDLKRTATSLGDLGIEVGRTWLVGAPAGSLDTTSPAVPFYYATSAVFDPLTAPLWDDTNSVRVPAAQLPLYAQEVRYVIHRLCAPAAPIPAVVLPDPDYCVSASSGVGGASKKGLVHGTGHLTGTGAVYFRITSRVMLANRNTVSFVQTVMF